MPTTTDNTATQDTAGGTLVQGVLALELTPGHAPAHAALQQVQAGRLAQLLGRDLGALVEGVRDLDLVFAAAHFDPAEVLRPGWPLHRRLDELRQRAPQPGQGPRIIAFGAGTDGKPPQPFQAEESLHGGALRVLPFLFAGEAAAAGAVADRMEQILLDLGMAKADTALCAQEAFDARVEHARYLTVHDLAAMTALQYRNQGLEPLWSVIETALLSPGSAAELDRPPEPLLRYSDGEARIALLPTTLWQSRLGKARDNANPETIERLYEGYEARLRQYASVLQAHGIEVTFAHCEDPAAL